MKRAVTEEKTFCDFCNQPGWAQCLVCDKDLCKDHRLELGIYLDRQDRNFRASLCPLDAQPLLPILESYRGKSTSWEKTGHNPEFNEAQLENAIAFLKTWEAVKGEAG